MFSSQSLKPLENLRFQLPREPLWRLVISRKLGVEKGGWCTREVKKGYGDKWCGNNSLCDSFPSLYALAYSKDAWVADCRDPWGEEGEWNLWFSRPFNDWEVKAVERFLLTLQGKRSHFCGKSFGALGFPLRWAFLLGKLCGGKF
ncbi:hypothetical protein CK203_091801 [Vitis vinifera]|uniref:Uncharacterized protein n=1 Tax=Vitis vinifera TaxID=29760 RepID=A0A438EQG9_VITVI|nr:hypothetical protein CK203_091801 [Vitis vinifera]